MKRLKILCKHCGEPEAAHHDYVPKLPDGCVCKPGEWGGWVKEICDAYSGDGNCPTCEHDKACHKS